MLTCANTARVMFDAVGNIPRGRKCCRPPDNQFCMAAKRVADYEWGACPSADDVWTSVLAASAHLFVVRHRAFRAGAPVLPGCGGVGCPGWRSRLRLLLFETPIWPPAWPFACIRVFKVEKWSRNCICCRGVMSQSSWRRIPWRSSSMYMCTCLSGLSPGWKTAHAECGVLRPAAWLTTGNPNNVASAPKNVVGH